MEDWEELQAAEFDHEQKKNGKNYVNRILDEVGCHMAEAIKRANRQCGVSDQTFWERLFIPSSNGSLLVELHGCKPDKCPEDPYGKLDFQGCNKYLSFGKQRILPGTGQKVEYAQDSVSFFKVYGLSFRPGAPSPNGYDYNDLLRKTRPLRNKYAHHTMEKLERITMEGLAEDIGLLKQLTQPLTRSAGWKGLEDYWAQVENDFREEFGNPPLDLEELACELFLPDEAVLPESQKRAVDEAAKWAHLKLRGGKVYGFERGALMGLLRAAPSVAALLGSRAADTPEEAVAAAVKQAELPVDRPELREPLYPGMRMSDAVLLKRAGSMMVERKESVLGALLNNFTWLVDESVFLAPEGRELLMDHVTPLLAKRHKRLCVDESVVTALFKQFRNSVPYTELELSELEPELREACREARQETHKNTKNAIKALRFLRQHKCLEIVASPTDSGYSYENIFQVVERYPDFRFLVLSMDRQLSEELRNTYGRNAVVAKPNLDGQLLLYRATREAYQAMLERIAQEEVPAVRTEPPALAGKHCLHVRRLPKTGSRVIAEWPAGERLELRLGKSIGEGGEGTIYTTSAPGGLVAKIYFARQLTQERRSKLRHMVDADPNIAGLCWPEALVYTDEGEWVGYLMPKAEGRELALTVFHPGRNNSTITAQGWTRKSLAQIAANIAAVFARMHEKNILMGDINPRNFLIAQDCTVYLVDCDSYQFGSFACPVGTPLYTPPEVHKQMKAQGREDYGYIRTLENEKYSLAVLLFEILMLGKAPYESRNTNNEDVIQAIIAGNFPYPYQDDTKDKEDAPRSNIMAPVGRWRQIWSHTTYRVKTSFYNTFTGKERLTAAEWAAELQEYVRQIERGHSSDQLVPELYKDTAERGGGTKMVELICSQCGRPFNLGEDVYNRRRERNEADLCSTHWEMRKSFRGRERTEHCGICGKLFTTNTAVWIERSKAGKPMLCDDCSNVSVTCSLCGCKYTEARDRVEELNAKGRALLCQSCFEREWPRVTCEADGCSESFRIPLEKYERLRRYGQPVLCGQCLNKQRAASAGR